MPIPLIVKEVVAIAGKNALAAAATAVGAFLFQSAQSEAQRRGIVLPIGPHEEPENKENPEV